MMTVNLELIDMLRERADVSYEEAKTALEKCDGDIVEALIYLEKQNKTKTKSAQEAGFLAGLISKGGKLLQTCNEIRLIISKDEDVIVNICLTIAIIITFIMPPLTIAGIILALLTKHKVRLERPGGKDMKINKTIEDISAAVSKVTDEVVDAIKKD